MSIIILDKDGSTASLLREETLFVILTKIPAVTPNGTSHTGAMRLVKGLREGARTIQSAVGMNAIPKEIIGGRILQEDSLEHGDSITSLIHGLLETGQLMDLSYGPINKLHKLSRQ